MANDVEAAAAASLLRLEKPAGCLKSEALDRLDDDERETLRGAQWFLVEHDWRKAFSNAEGLDGTYSLPFDACVFQFRFCIESEFPIDVCAALWEEDGWALAGTIVYRINDTWECFGTWIDGAAGEWGKPVFDGDRPSISKTLGAALLIAVRKQVEAICVGLDAAVIISDRQVPPSKLVAARRRRTGKRPVEYCVLKLNRERFAKAHQGQSEYTGVMRLHFRRAHDRYLDEARTRKVRINWTLVGNPDLGFVDKFYRLR